MSTKVLITIPKIKDSGGAERVASVWANQLVKHGYNVYILLLHRCESEYSVSDEIKVYSVANNENEYLKLTYFERYCAIRTFIKKIKPNYIIPFLPEMQIWSMAASVGVKTRHIATVRNNLSKSNVKGILNKYLLKRCYAKADKIIIQASEQKDFFKGKIAKKCVLIPNPLAITFERNYKEKLSETPLNFLAVGRLNPQKNYKMMIKGFAKICKEYPNAILRIFGTGEQTYIDEIRKLINSLNLQSNILLMGKTSFIENEYKQSDIFLMTSDYEGLPNALIEAMASRLVCISTNCKTGPSDLITHSENGFLIPTNDENALIRSIKDVLSLTHEQREIIAENNRCFSSYNEIKFR